MAVTWQDRDAAEERWLLRQHIEETMRERRAEARRIRLQGGDRERLYEVMAVLFTCKARLARLDAQEQTTAGGSAA